MKLCKSSDLNRRLKDVRTVLHSSARFRNWTVVCQRAELLAGKHEEVHQRLRSCPRSLAKGYPTFSFGLDGQSKEVYDLPYVKVAKVVSEVLFDYWVSEQEEPSREESGAAEEPKICIFHVK